MRLHFESMFFRQTGAMEPPKGLQAAGKALWKQTIDGVAQGWQLDIADLVVLERCARWADDEARLQARVAAEGDVVAGSTGSPVVNPAARELRQVRSLIATNIKRVEIAPPRASTRHLSKRGRDALADARRNRWR